MKKLYRFDLTGGFNPALLEWHLTLESEGFNFDLCILEGIWSQGISLTDEFQKTLEL